MWVYWALFTLPLIGVIVPGRLPKVEARIVWFFVIVAMAFVIGLRHQVGGDWYNYLYHFGSISTLSFNGALRYGDPGYSLINWLAARAGGDMHYANLVCAGLLMLGTAQFCRTQPKPWLALLVAVPYLLVVVGMGYTRQATALGLAMMGMVALGQQRVRDFVIWIAVAALFHKTAVLLVPIAALAVRRNRVWTATWVFAASGLMYWTLLQSDASNLWENYVEADMDSQGGMIRVAMNAIPAVILLLFGKRLIDDPQTRRTWKLLAMLALACIPLVSLASTAVDRMALYLIPLQMLVFSRLHRLAPGRQGRTLAVMGVVFYYAAVLWVWLHFATHSEYWLPYQFMPIG